MWEENISSDQQSTLSMHVVKNSTGRLSCGWKMVASNFSFRYFFPPTFSFLIHSPLRMTSMVAVACKQTRHSKRRSKRLDRPYWQRARLTLGKWTPFGGWEKWPKMERMSRRRKWQEEGEIVARIKHEKALKCNQDIDRSFYLVVFVVESQSMTTICDK